MTYIFNTEDSKARYHDGLNVLKASDLELFLADENVQCIAKCSLFTWRLKRVFFSL